MAKATIAVRDVLVDGPGRVLSTFDDPPTLPKTGEIPAALLRRALPLAGTPGQVYVERLAIPLHVAHAAGVRFAPEFAGRPAVLAAMRGRDGVLTAVHGRYLHTVRGQNKMLTVGAPGGMIGGLDGWRATPLIIVEGLFDVLSLVTCGWSAVATVGRWAPWLPEVAAGRVAWLAFDASRPGEADAELYAARLAGAEARRLPPPPRSKDWNTALVKRGPAEVTHWLHRHLDVHPPIRGHPRRSSDHAL